VVKALRYYSDGPGIDSRWCHWRFFSVVPPTEPCALRSTQPLKVSISDFSWDKGGRWVWLTNYHPFSAEMSRKSGVVTYTQPLGPPRPVAGHLYFTIRYILCSLLHVNIFTSDTTSYASLCIVLRHHLCVALE